jgi:hypothetical protein
MYKRLIVYVIKILIGLKVSKMSDRNGTAIISPRFTHESLNDEAGIIAGHAVATEACTENNQRGGLHLHAMIFSAICPALLQGCVDIQEVCNTVSQVLDSLFCATLPREYHIKHLLKKELPFYPTADHSFKKLIRQGRAMLMPPDPSDEHQFQNFVYTSISSFGIHSHDRFRSGRCRKGKKGLTRCALSKPSGLVDSTMPVQLIDITPTKTSSTQKVNISYEVAFDIESRTKALQQIPSKFKVGPLFCERDPRLIVFEIQRPSLIPLPELTEQSDKNWIIFQFKHSMHFKDDFLPSTGTELCKDRLTPYDCKPIFINHTTSVNKNPMTRKRPSEIQTNQWKLPMPEFLPKLNASFTIPQETETACLGTSKIVLWH